MTMTFSFEDYIYSILQVVALVVCFQGNVSGARVQGCVGSRLGLRCPEMKVIHITAVVLGDSECTLVSCCIRNGDCTRNASDNHTTDVRIRCDNIQRCTVNVIKEGITCGHLGARIDNDFERITFNCIDDPRDDTTVRPTEHATYDNGYNQEDSSSAVLVIVIVCIVILIVVIAIIASVVTVRRKKKRQVKSSDTVKMPGRETDREESNYINEAHGPNPNDNVASTFSIYINTKPKEVQTSLKSDAMNVEAPKSDYCELERADVERVQRDSEYEQLDNGRNYEPLVVYEQPNADNVNYLTLID